MASRRRSDTNGARAQAGDSSSVIYDAAKDSDWLRVLELCETNPNCVNYQGPDGSTALHLACSQKCPDTAVFETLLQTSPRSILIEENKGMVPLHYACRFQASADVVSVLVHLFPELGMESVSKRDRKGRIPLYYAEKDAEKEGAPFDVVSMLREMYPSGSPARMEDDEVEPPPMPEVEPRPRTEVEPRPRTEVEPPPKPEPANRQSSFYRSFLESSKKDVWADPQTGPPEENGFGDHEVLEQYKMMAEHEALRRVKNATGKDLEKTQDRKKVGKSQGVLLVKTNKMLLKTRLPEPRRITCAGTVAELQEPSLPSFRPTPTFCGRTTQIEPEVTPGELVDRDEEVPTQQRVIQCLGCREKLRCKQNAMMVRCANCSIESPAVSTSQEMEV